MGRMLCLSMYVCTSAFGVNAELSVTCVAVSRSGQGASVLPRIGGICYSELEQVGRLVSCLIHYMY